MIAGTWLALRRVVTVIPLIETLDLDVQSLERRHAQYNHLGGQIAVRQGRWKAVWRGLRADPDAAGELYDLEADRAEQKDRAAAEPEVFARLDAIRRDGRTEPAIAAFRFGRYGASSAK